METTSTTPASPLASPAPQPGGGNPATAMAGGEDSRLADIIRRRDSGEKLTASDRGYLGARLKKQLGSVPKPATAPPENPLFSTDGGLPPATPAADSPAVDLAAPLYSPADIRLAAEGILTGLDQTTQSIIADQIESLGGDKATAERWRQAVAMKGAKPLMVEGSEPVILALCKLFKCEPNKLVTTLKGGGFLAGLTMWGFGIKAAVKAITELKGQQPKPEEKP